MSEIPRLAIEITDACTIAQNLARNCGYAVFSCLENKAPATPHGFRDATKDVARIAEMWRRHPGILIGIATGEASDINVLDIDVKHPTAIAWWKAAQKRMRPTRTYSTRSGGVHAFFRHADGVRNTQSKLAYGVDTRGTGGYAIDWSAAGFECLDHAPPAPWPEWLLECVLWEKPKPTITTTIIDHPEYAEKAVQGVLRAVSDAREGERNKILYWGARRMGERVKAGQIAQGEAIALLLAAARSVGLDTIEAQRTVSSAWGAA